MFEKCMHNVKIIDYLNKDVISTVKQDTVIYAAIHLQSILRIYIFNVKTYMDACMKYNACSNLKLPKRSNSIFFDMFSLAITYN